MTDPAHGAAAIQSGMVIYTPTADYFGSDRFVYTIIDGFSIPITATVLLTITAVNDPPVAEDDLVGTKTNESVVVDVLVNDSDIDGDGLTVTAVGDASHGTVMLRMG